MRLVALATHGQDARVVQTLQLAHQAALADLRPAGDLIGIKALIRLAIQQAQHLLLGRGEQSIAERDGWHGWLESPKKGTIGPFLGLFNPVLIAQG
ncbi:hypothetical protein D3C84_842420 [compost metagenome]